MQKLLIPSPHKHSGNKQSSTKGAPSASEKEAIPEPEDDQPSEDFEELNIEPDACEVLDIAAEGQSKDSKPSKHSCTRLALAYGISTPHVAPVGKESIFLAVWIAGRSSCCSD